jgi:hypothetical protein
MRRKARGNLLEKNGGRAWKQTGSSLKIKVKKKISSSLLITNLLTLEGRPLLPHHVQSPMSNIQGRKEMAYNLLSGI